MKQIIWVFGTSASGKETFIRAVMKDSSLQDKFGLTNLRVTYSDESLKNLGKLNDARSKIVPEVSDLLNTYDVILIKWQYGDTLLNTPEKLYSTYPAVQHRIIKLIVGEDEQLRRLQTKNWWHDIGKESQFIEKEQHLVDRSISSLESKFNVAELKW